MKKALSIVALLAFCASAMAADPAGGGKNANSSRRLSMAKYHQVYGRLGLTDEQIEKIDAIYDEYSKKSSELYKKAYSNKNEKLTSEDRKAKYKKLREKVAELNAERDKKILEVLTEEQKKKLEEANKIIAEFQTKTAELRKGYTAIRKIKDRAKKMEAYKALSAKRRKIYADRDATLDEKIGKLPERPEIPEGQGQQQGLRTQ